MKNTKVTLVPLTKNDREQFILDNQWAFKYGALQEFGARDNHIDADGEIISRKTNNLFTIKQQVFVFIIFPQNITDIPYIYF